MRPLYHANRNEIPKRAGWEDSLVFDGRETRVRVWSTLVRVILVFLFPRLWVRKVARTLREGAVQWPNVNLWHASAERNEAS